MYQRKREKGEYDRLSDQRPAEQAPSLLPDAFSIRDDSSPNPTMNETYNSVAKSHVS